MSNYKTIHLIFDKYYPDIGGVQVYMEKAHSPLIKKGWNIKVHCSKNGNSSLLSNEKINGIEINRYNSFIYKFTPFLLKINFFEKNIISLQEFFILPHYLIYLFTIFLKLFNQKKYILTLNSHGYFGNDISMYPELSKKIKKIINNYIGVFLVNLCVDEIMAISDSEINALVNAGIKPTLIKKIFYGLDNQSSQNIDENSNNETKEVVEKYSPYILQVGRLDRYKNYEAAIKTLSFLPNEINFIISGPVNDINYKNELEKLSIKLGVEDRVKFTGPVEGANKFYLMKKSLAYIQLAHTEGFGMVVLEAKSQGVICIVNKNTGMDESVKNNINGYTIHWNNTELIAEKIKFIYSNFSSDIIKRMKEINVAEAKKLTWERSSEYIENIFLNKLN